MLNIVSRGFLLLLCLDRGQVDGKARVLMHEPLGPMSRSLVASRTIVGLVISKRLHVLLADTRMEIRRMAEFLMASLDRSHDLNALLLLRASFPGSHIMSPESRRGYLVILGCHGTAVSVLRGER